MRMFPLLMLSAAACWAEGPFATWKMNPARSTFIGGPYPKSLTVRIEPHAKGEVFTLDEIGADGRATTSSTLLYLDGKPRGFGETDCSGTQSSRRLDDRTVEILRDCGARRSVRFVRRLAAQPKELVLDITEQQPERRRLEWHLVLEKQ